MNNFDVTQKCGFNAFEEAKPKDPQHSQIDAVIQGTITSALAQGEPRAPRQIAMNLIIRNQLLKGNLKEMGENLENMHLEFFSAQLLDSSSREDLKNLVRSLPKDRQTKLIQSIIMKRHDNLKENKYDLRYVNQKHVDVVKFFIDIISTLDAPFNIYSEENFKNLMTLELGVLYSAKEKDAYGEICLSIAKLIIKFLPQEKRVQFIKSLDYQEYMKLYEWAEKLGEVQLLGFIFKHNANVNRFVFNSLYTTDSLIRFDLFDESRIHDKVVPLFMNGLFGYRVDLALWAIHKATSGHPNDSRNGFRILNHCLERRVFEDRPSGREELLKYAISFSPFKRYTLLYVKEEKESWDFSRIAREKLIKILLKDPEFRKLARIPENEDPIALEQSINQYIERLKAPTENASLGFNN